MSAESEQRVPDLSSCLAVGVGSILSVALMAYHPTTGGGSMAEVVQEITDEAVVNRTVHGTLIFLMGWVLFGLVDLARYLGWQHASVRAGMLAYAAGMLWLTGAALVSGGVVPGVAEAYVGEPEAELAGLHTIFRLTWEMNQALANAGTVAWGIAIVLLSIGLQKQGGLARPIAWFGMFVGGAAGLGIVSGHLSLHLHGMMAVVLGVALWSFAVAVWMFRLRRRE